LVSIIVVKPHHFVFCATRQDINVFGNACLILKMIVQSAVLWNDEYSFSFEVRYCCICQKKS